jgi:Zn-finger nucleic acid-binding protein
MLKCPKCQVPLCQIAYEGSPIQVCPQCRGAVVDESDLARIREHRRLWWSEEQKNETIALAMEADSLARLSCPQCGLAMAKYRVQLTDSPFHVDCCKACRLLWFDSGELELIRMQYAKAARDQPSEDEQARLTKVALAEAAFKMEVYGRTMREEMRPAMAILAAAFPAEALAWAAGKVAQLAVKEVRQGLQDSPGSGRARAFVLAAIGLAVAVGLALLSYFLALTLRGLWASR